MVQVWRPERILLSKEAALMNLSSSIMQTIQARYESRVVYALSFVDDVMSLFTSVFYLTWDSLFDGDFRRNGKAVFQKHYAEIRGLVPSDRLLEYHISEGWEPLCRFLEVPVPDVPFPEGNDVEAFHRSCKESDYGQMRAAFVRYLAVPLGVISSSIAYFLWRK